MALAPGAAAKPVSVVQGKRYPHRIFPSNAFTVKDKRQLTGRRVHFRRGKDYPIVNGRLKRKCGKADYSICDAFRELNKLDGFDLQPRVTVPFTGAIDLKSVGDKNFFIAGANGKRVSGLRQLTFDPKTRTLAGISDAFLQEGRRYRIVVTNGIRDAAGKRIRACRRRCVVPFTTRTASGELVRIRRALDAMTPSKLSFSQDGKDDVFLAAGVAPSIASGINGIVRSDQVKAEPNADGGFCSDAVPIVIAPCSAGYFASVIFISPLSHFASASAPQDKPAGPT